MPCHTNSVNVADFDELCRHYWSAFLCRNKGAPGDLASEHGVDIEVHFNERVTGAGRGRIISKGRCTLSKIYNIIAVMYFENR